MNFLRRIFSHQDEDHNDPTFNPERTDDLYALTEEGYIIAQDIACQFEYVEHAVCPDCGGELLLVAQINRASQGLNELVCACKQCNQRSSLIFDVSNTTYQTWMSRQLGDLYVRNYDGPPRRPARRQKQRTRR